MSDTTPTQATTETTPTRGCYAAADYLIDFETPDGVNNSFKESLKNMPSELDAVAALARHINNATRASELLAACHAALEMRAKLSEASNTLNAYTVRVEAGNRASELAEQIRAAIAAATAK